MIRHLVLRLAVVLAMAFAAACGEPPSREINEAKGALDAARAAGADQYAAPSLKDAQTAYEKSLAAVEQRDYRLALNHALDARERAHEAVKEAGNEKARVRADVARALQSADDRLRVLHGRVKDAEAAKAARTQISSALDVLKPLDGALEEAREEVGREDFLGARKSLGVLGANLDKATSEIDAVLRSRGPRRPARPKPR